MNVDNINQAEDLIKKYKSVISAIESIKEINGEDGGDSNTFILVDKDTNIEVSLRGFKSEVLRGICDVLYDNKSKIASMLEKL